MTIGDRIKHRREELRLSQDELAKKLGYKSRSSLNKIELNQRDLPQSKIKAIADALGTTPSYIMGWDENSNEPEKGRDSEYQLAPDEIILISSYRELNPQGKEYILQTLAMAKQVYIKSDSISNMGDKTG